MWLTFVLGFGCGGSYPSEPSPLPGVLSADDDRGYWQMVVDEHLYVTLAVESQATTCDVDGDTLTLNANPIYSDFGDDGPRWTVDLVASEVDPHAQIRIECGDVDWRAKVQVTEE